MFAGKRHDRLIAALALCEVIPEMTEILDGTLDAAANDHGARLAADLIEGQHLLVEMIHHNLGLEPDRMVMALHKAAELFPGALSVELRIAFHRFDQLVIAG